jgi:POLQ-like helicase
MRPELNSRRLFGITRSKGKMYELGLPEELHIAVPANSEPQELFVLTVGTLGDAAATLSDSEDIAVPLPPTTVEELGFSASFFDAFLQSRFKHSLTRDTTLLAASAYYLARRPGSSLVMARRFDEATEDPPVDKLLRWILRSDWANPPRDVHPLFDSGLGDVARLLAFHFFDGSNLEDLTTSLIALRRRAYAGASARDLLLVDIIAAIIRMRVAASAWTTLPGFTGITAERWATAIRRPEFPKELWPSQMLLGQAGLFAGTSGIVQMPTSAGKTRSVEIVLRSAFLSGRTKLAVVVAPFRALCHEIGTSLRHAFRDDDVKVNELSDAMQLDFLQQVAELLGSEAPISQYILVLTPEKLLYVLRQTPKLVSDIGLVVYDEGHQFDSGSRGVTYELLLTEIKALLQTTAQTVLISAVIQNAQEIGTWLMGNNAKVVDGTNLLPTARSVAFASWVENLGQIMFFEPGSSYQERDYFVPRVIEQHKLKLVGNEKKARYFPETKEDAKDIALYLGIRLASQGSVAIFCGRKDTASGIAARAVDIYERTFDIEAPSAYANTDELQRLKNLIDGHFGEKNTLSRAASLGIFVHHGTTPHGLRLSIEYAMQTSRIKFVACTSTLAQGVNLPIRYLIVSGIYQGAERIKVRDFQNLIGRAGRSGMHTEGLVVFSDPAAFDKRRQRTESWKFSSSVELLTPSSSESTTSSLLGVLAPIDTGDGNGELPLTPDALIHLVIADENAWLTWTNDVVRANPQSKFNVKKLVGELRRRRHLILAIESYLMANRGNGSTADFMKASEELAASTLAYHLASEELKPAVKQLFVSIAEYVESREPAAAKQAVYAKTLLGVKSAKAVEQWVNDNRALLLTLESNEGWLQMVWSLFAEQSDDKFFHAVAPESLSIQLATKWIQGVPYMTLFAHSTVEKGSKPWGEKQRRKLTDDDTVVFCESTLGFECSLILAAVAQFLFGDSAASKEEASALTMFQKALKYGLPDWLAISCYECGFADRVLAQKLAEAVRIAGFEGKFFFPALTRHSDVVRTVLTNYPSYFATIVDAFGESPRS